MSGRDLVLEFKNLQAKKRATSCSAGFAQPSAKRKAAPSAPGVEEKPEEPAPKYMDMTDLRRAVGEAQHSDHDHVFFIRIKDCFQDEVIDSYETYDLETVMSVQFLAKATFFMTGYDLYESPIYKLAESEKPLYCWKEGDQFWIASQLFSSEKELQQLQKGNDPIHVAAWGHGSGTVPDKLHLPFWSKKHNPSVAVVSIWSAYLDCLEQRDHMAACLSQNIDELQNEAFADAGTTEDAGATEDADDADEASGSAEKADDFVVNKDINRGHHKRGGWLPKIAKLIAAFWSKRTVHCNELALEYYSSSWTLSYEVDKMLKQSK